MQQSVSKSQVRKALQACRKSFIFVGLFSCVVNILMLTVPLFMLQIYDRVLAAQSYDTLIFLSLLAGFALVIMGVIDATRSRLLIRISRWLDNNLSPYAFMRSTENIMQDGRFARQSLRDVSVLREFLSGMNILSLFDMPWTIIYLAVVYMLHPFIGVLVTGGILVLFGLSLANELMTRDAIAEANKEGMETQIVIDSTLSNAETIHAMGMTQSVLRKWFKQNEKVLKNQEKASSRSGTMLAIAKAFRMALQVSVLGVGAYFVLQNQFTPGGMIAASILAARALQPVERAIGTWKAFGNAREAYRRLSDFLSEPDKYASAPFLTVPKGLLQLESVYYRAPGVEQPIIKGISVQINPGDVVAVVGPSGAGKSTLVRLMLGIFPVAHGRISLDGCDVAACDRMAIGPHLGYLPQEVRLFAGSVYENVARMESAGTDDKVVAAAKLAGTHEMILRLNNGYNTPIEQYSLSGGQQQRIGLARAVYGGPCFIVLDEPNSSLDDEGNQALLDMVMELKRQQKTIVIVTHQTQILQVVDKMMVINQGMLQAYGPRDKVLEHLQQQKATAAAKNAMEEETNV